MTQAIERNLASEYCAGVAETLIEEFKQMTGVDWMVVSAALLVGAVAQAGYLAVVIAEYRRAKRRAQQ